MNRIILTAFVLGTMGAGGALAQTSTTPPSSSQASPMATPPSSTMTPGSTSGGSKMMGAPVSGANSFTMAQAQKRIEDQGYSHVTALKKDDQSVWRGQAMKDGKATSVALDYQGHVTAN